MSGVEEVFISRLRCILAKGKKDGPHTNVFEYRQEACRSIEALRCEVIAEYGAAPSLTRLAQLVVLDAALGQLLLTVEEEERGAEALLRGYGCWQQLEDGDVTRKPLEDVQPAALADVIASPAPHAAPVPYWGMALPMMLLNGLSVFVTKSTDAGLKGLGIPLDISVKLLQRAESLYQQWDSSVECPIVQLPIRDNGELDLEEVPVARHAAYWERFLTEDTRISTLFFLAQALTGQGDLVQAFRYCHVTLYMQLVLHHDVDPQEWARNTLQLASHYCNFGAFGQALHCLRAAEAMMPNSKPDETTRGVVAWSYGRYYKHRLLYHAQRQRKDEPLENAAVLNFSNGWLNFPVEGVPECKPVPPLTTYDEVRNEFKQGLRWINEALNYYPFELLCTSHIELHQDICRLYDGLSTFETDTNRVIALTQRQISIMETFPSRLNFNAYPTLVRQLLYDNGCLREHLVELRIAQRRRCEKNPDLSEKTLSDKGLNRLVDRAQKDFYDFCQTWMVRGVDEKAAPHIGNVVIEEGCRVAFFRALMRIARLHTVKAYATAQEEYEGIREACEGYEKAVAFAKRNAFPLDAPACDGEVEYAKELIGLLRAKQSDLYTAFAH